MIKCAYSANVSTFLDDVRHGRLQSLIQEGSKNAGFGFGKREQYSWSANTPHIVRIVEALPNDVVIALELLDPVVQRRNRADVVLFGVDNAGMHRLILLELKQWSHFEPVEDSDRLVYANLYGSTVGETVHPSLQASLFVDRLQHWVTDCDGEGSSTIACDGYAVLFNMSDPFISKLRSGQYSWIQQKAPVIGASEIDFFANSLRQYLKRGDGRAVYDRFVTSKIRPSRKFIEFATRVINGRDFFPLIPEQYQVYDGIRRALINATQEESKSVIIVSGNPGSGKTAIALQSMSAILQDNLRPTYVVKSAAMKTSVQKYLGDHLRSLISYTDRFGYLPQSSCDVILVDEAHRLDGIATIDWSSGKRRYKTIEELKASFPIVREIIRAAKVSVFFIDERQIIQPDEANRIQNIYTAAQQENAEIISYQLESQHRLAGSLEFIDWVDTLLASPTPTLRQLGDIGNFQFGVLDDPAELIEIHEDWEAKLPNQCRLLTGWCWDWVQQPLEDGSLAKEVSIPGSIAYPWEAPKIGKPGRLAPGIARGEFWATAPSGAQSFGSVYTAQGFDIPTVCLLWPRDLLWRGNRWVGNPMRKSTKPRERGGHPHYDNVDPKLSKLDDIEIIPFLLNIYRILMTRATKRLYISFLDSETRNMVRSLLL
jgi:tRNA A37 threonylcarbamoyladenosine biosynthesis protein TsaE